MKFDDLDQQMRMFETAMDQFVPPDVFIVVRVDGRAFTRLTRDVHPFEAPFDERFRDMMVQTAEHLMNCGFRVIYGYTQSDEISLLLDRAEELFNRKTRKLLSVFAGEASAKFSVLLGSAASFDCRLSQLATIERVVDYFRWRNEDAHRNALNAHCYWRLRKEGRSSDEATATLHRFSVAQKNELLFERGVNFNDLPGWQKRGVGLYWEDYEVRGLNPKTEEACAARRRRIRCDFNLPMKDAYDDFLHRLLAQSRANRSTKLNRNG